MLNYNLNIIEPNNSGRRRNLLVGKVDWTWSRGLVLGSGTTDGSSIIFGTGSILYVPYQPTTFFVSGAFETGSVSSGSAVGQPVRVSVTGSGVWPTTGSNSLSILIGSALGFNQSQVLTLSAGAGNMNLSGSRISSSFIPVANDEYNINFGVYHTKGNIWNPNVIWRTQNLSPSTTTGNVNGYTASFNLVKNENEPLASVTQITSSFSSSFQYQYNFGVTASLTSSINNVTGSTTMSIEIPEAGVSASQQWFNETTSIARLTGSFAAANNNPYNITASVIFNKGNVSNSAINWLATGSYTYTASLSSSFVIKKDANNPVTLVTTNDIQSNSTSSTFTNNYAFDITASVSTSFTTTYTSDSASIILAKSKIEIPELGVNIQSYSTSSVNITSSFRATTGINPYNITGSVQTYSVPFIEYLVVGGGGAGAYIKVPAPFNARMCGGGGGGFVTSSGNLIPGVSYPVKVGAGGLKNQNPVITDFVLGTNGQTSSFNGTIAYGGGFGGLETGTPFNINSPGAANINYPDTVGYGGGNFGTGSQGNGGLIQGGGGGFQWLNGTYYSAYGGGVSISGTPPGQRIFHQPGTGSLNPGAGGNGNDVLENVGNGLSGSVIIRYKGDTPRATGGLITSASGYIYHTFTSSSAFAVNEEF